MLNLFQHRIEIVGYRGERVAAMDEIKEKERRVRDFLRSKGLKALFLKRQANFSWMTCGGLNLVGITTEMGATTLLITEDSKFVISNNIEAPRMIEEEGLEKRFQRSAQCAKAFYEGFKVIDLKPYAAENVRSNTVVTVRLPSGVDVNKVREIMKERYNIIITGGWASFAI
jgi:hypothetical protein